MSHSIALVEDDLIIQQMYRTSLELRGYKVQIACNGIEGLKLLRSNEPDLILLDIKMPVMGGDEMLRIMRADQRYAHLKVFLLTNLSKDEAPSCLRLLHVDRYIVKAHHTPSQIIQMIQETLDK